MILGRNSTVFLQNDKERCVSSFGVCVHLSAEQIFDEKLHFFAEPVFQEVLLSES